MTQPKNLVTPIVLCDFQYPVEADVFVLKHEVLP